jgi:hypothetical protein
MRESAVSDLVEKRRCFVHSVYQILIGAVNNPGTGQKKLAVPSAWFPANERISCVLRRETLDEVARSAE